MRDVYWGSAESGGVHPLNLPAYYWTWFGYGLEELGGLAGVVDGPKDESEATSVFERAGNIHMLLRVQKMSPTEVPFLNGITYEVIPQLLVPRFINSEKGAAHAANIMLTVNYGLQSMEVAAGGTSIAWGLVSEAFANFGYLGIGALAVFLAVFYAFFSRITVGVPMTSLRFVVGLLIMGAAVKADTMALFITSQFQAIVGVSLAAFFLMRRQSNPFATGEEHTILQLEGRVEREGTGRRQEAVSPSLGSVFQKDGVSVEQTGGKRIASDGGVVRTLPIRTPKRIASWMPRRVRAAVVAQYAAQADGGEEEGKVERPRDQESKRPKDGRERPRQVAVPYQNYRRYRG
jgi:hypothetical protein